MTTQTRIKKLNQDMGILRADVQEMKRFLLSPLQDPEGRYRDSFVRKLLARSQNRGPFYRFSGRDEFLKHVQSKV